MTDQDHRRPDPYQSPVPLVILGKATLSDDHQQASVLVWWFGGIFSDSDVRKAVIPFVRNCYPEAENIKPWQVPGKYDRVTVTFDIVGTPKRKNKKIDWTWRYETPAS